MSTWERNLNALLVIILSGVLLGGFWVQLVEHETPCPLCLLQRLGMIGVACGALLNVRFGVQMAHYALSLLSVLMGGAVALRQVSLHVCPGLPAFGLPVLGLSLYTWSFLVFVCSALFISLLLFLYNPKESSLVPHSMNPWCKLAFGLLLLITLGNIVTTFQICGFGPCHD